MDGFGLGVGVGDVNWKKLRSWEIGRDMAEDRRAGYGSIGEQVSKLRSTTIRSRNNKRIKTIDIHVSMPTHHRVRESG